MVKMKKIWQRPKLIILTRGRPEEFVLAGCKVLNNPANNLNKLTGCMYKTACLQCAAPGTS